MARMWKVYSLAKEEKLREERRKYCVRAVSRVFLKN
jgi:hypothetical protein